MRKITTFLTTAVIVACSLMPCMGSNSGKYSLKYAQNAPGDVNVLTADLNLESSAKSSVTIKSTKFTTYITGASADAYSIFNGKTSKTQVVNRVGTYTIDYPGISQPKTGAPVKVHIELSDYVPSRGVTAQGTVSL